jgi:type IV pilus assembly protein PilE
MELLAALSIVAILAVLSVPSYQQQIRQARRADGQTALLRVAIAQERFRASCLRYADRVDGAPDCTPGAESLGLGLSAQSPDGHYRLDLTEADAPLDSWHAPSPSAIRSAIERAASSAIR